MALNPDKCNNSQNRDINRETIYDEGAGQQMERAQRGGQRTRQPEDEKSEFNRKMGAPNTETATELAGKGLEEKGDAMDLSAILPWDPKEISRGEGFIEQISPIDKNWEIVDRPINPVSQLALAKCQHKLTNEMQGAPSDRSSSRVGAGDPQPRSLLSHIVEVMRAIAPTRRPDRIAQAHRTQHPSWAKHVGPGGTPKGTDSEVGVVFTFASQTLSTTVLSQVSQEMDAYTAHSPADVVEYQIIRKASEEHPDPVVNHPQQVESDSPHLRRVATDKIAGRPKNAGELQFSSLHSLGDIPLKQPKYSDKFIAKSDSPFAPTRLLLPGEWSRSEE